MKFDARIARILMDDLQVAPSEILDSAYLRDDLGAKGIDITTIVMDAEDEFGVSLGELCVFEDSTVKEFKTCILEQLPKSSKTK